jgi:uncharacterized protein YggE
MKYRKKSLISPVIIVILSALLGTSYLVSPGVANVNDLNDIVQEKREITTTAYTAQRSFEPDRETISLQIETRDKSTGIAWNQNTQIATHIISAIKNNGIDTNQIEIRNLFLLITFNLNCHQNN